MIRHWLTHYWEHDFSKSRTLRFILSTFLSELRSHPTILGSPRDARIIKSLRNLFKRQRKQKQEKMGEDIQSCDRASLSTTPGLFDTRRSSNSGIMVEEQRKDSGFLSTKVYHGRPNSTSSSSSATISSPWTTRVSSSLKSIKRSMWHRASSSSSSGSDEIQHYPSPQPSISTPIPSHTTTKSCRHQSHYSYPPNLTPSPSHRLLRPSPLGIERLSATLFGGDTNNKSIYRPFILQYRTETVAQQFCMIERQMLQYVTWDELVELRWKDRRSGAASRSPIVDDSTKEQSGVEQLIGYFNRVSIHESCDYSSIY